MHFKRIYNIESLKVGDKVAVISGNDNIEDLIGHNINLSTGIITEKSPTSVLVETRGTNLVISDILLRVQTIYLIIEEKIDIKPKLSLVNLERKLRKAEREKRRYKAILKQKFNVTEEDLKTNFKMKSTEKVKAQSSAYFTYKCLDMELPYFLDGKLINIPAICSFRKTCGKSDILCTITAYYNNQKVAIGEGKATCHPEDEYNEEVGELISSTKALNNITQKLY